MTCNAAATCEALCKAAVSKPGMFAGTAVVCTYLHEHVA